jgi:hypothetical protein
MPIDMEQWDSGKVRSLEERIMSFLKSGKYENLAFSLPEIMKVLGYKVKKNDPYGMVHMTNVRNALENLVKEGKVEKKAIKEVTGEETYYKITPIKEIRIIWDKKTESNEDKGATGTS